MDHRTSSGPDPALARSDTGRLRLVLRANAASSAATGAVALVAAGWVVDVLGAGTPLLARIVGAALVVFALDVALLARTGAGRLPAAALGVSAVDAAWVLATVVVISTGALTGVGVALAGVIAAVVAAFGTAQARVAVGLRRAGAVRAVPAAAGAGAGTAAR